LIVPRWNKDINLVHTCRLQIGPITEIDIEFNYYYTYWYLGKPANTGTNLAQQMCLDNKTNSLKVVRIKTQRKEAWNEKNQIKRREMVHFLKFKKHWEHSTLGEVNQHEHWKINLGWDRLVGAGSIWSRICWSWFVECPDIHSSLLSFSLCWEQRSFSY